MLACCTRIFSSSLNLSNEDMLGVEKQLGNIKSSHKSITFTGLVHLAHGRAQYVHYLTDPVFCQQHPAGMSPEQAEQAANNPGPVKLGQSFIKKKIENLLEQVVSFRIAQNKMIKELGFDMTRESYLRGENSIVIMVEIIPDFLLVVLFEMNALKADFFDCEQYMTTIDDLVQSLIEIFERDVID